MARLIDADALICDIENNFWDYETVDGISATLVLKQTVKDIRNYPTVDAVPVVHGRWLYDSGSGKYFCSACDENALLFRKDTLGLGEVYEVCLTDYCPNCGAKMDLEVE